MTTIDVSALDLPIATAVPSTHAQACLKITKDGAAAGDIPLAREVTVLGRNSGMSHVVLEHQSVSRKHAAVVHAAEGGVWLIDLGSVHGTFHNTKRLQPRHAVQLQEGDSIKFGESSRAYAVCLSPDLKPASGPKPAFAMPAVPKKSAIAAPSAPAAVAKPTGTETQHAQTADAAAAARAQRRAEIEAITADMLSTAPTYKRPAPAADVPSDHDSDSNNDEGNDDMEEDSTEAAASTAAELSPEERARRTARRLELPISHEAALKGHSKAVTALSVDPGGGRVASGSTDYKVRLYDFGGMDKHHRSFREFEPEEGNVVVALSHSPSGDRFLCCTASSQPKVYDRDGAEQAQFARGDPYIRDMKQTKGHITVVTGGQWHPTEKNTVLTCSMDGTVRIWDLNGKCLFDKLLCKTVLKVRGANKGGKVCVTAASYSTDARTVAVGGGDGSVRILPAGGGIGGSTAMGSVAEAAHGAGNAVSCVVFQEDGHLLASRGTDDTVKLWDTRKFKAPVKVITGIDTHMETSNVAFSPDGRVLAVGTNVNPRSQDCGVVKFYSSYSTETAAEMQIGLAGPGASVVRLLWHPKLNQIMASTSSGFTKVLYDPDMSVKGATMTSTRSHRSAAMDYVPDDIVGEIHNPHALPMYRQEHTTKRAAADAARKDPKRSKRPEAPMTGPGVGGRVSSSYNFTQFVMQNKLIGQKNLREQDAREELLKFADSAAQEPEYFGGAYSKNKSHLAEKTLEQEEADFKEEQQKLLDN